jgi:hypothetical protein
MRTRSLTTRYLSYEAALKLWESRKREELLIQAASATKTRASPAVLKYQRLLAVARAKDWAASVYGSAHNKESDCEDVSSPLPDHTTIHPGAAREDIKLHIHKAVSSIGFGSDHPVNILIHPVVQREYILLLLRFKESTLPSKADFALLIQVYLVHLKEAAKQIDLLLDKVEFGTNDTKP